MRTGKNTVDKTSATFDSMPNPKQIKNIGARAVLGTDWRPITYGYTMVRTGRNSERTRARKKPIRTSPRVTTRSLTKVPSARGAIWECQTSRGLGKIAGETSNFLVYHCQK